MIRYLFETVKAPNFYTLTLNPTVYLRDQTIFSGEIVENMIY